MPSTRLALTARARFPACVWTVTLETGGSAVTIGELAVVFGYSIFGFCSSE